MKLFLKGSQFLCFMFEEKCFVEIKRVCIKSCIVKIVKIPGVSCCKKTRIAVNWLRLLRPNVYWVTVLLTETFSQSCCCILYKNSSESPTIHLESVERKNKPKYNCSNHFLGLYWTGGVGGGYTYVCVQTDKHNPALHKHQLCFCFEGALLSVRFSSKLELYHPIFSTFLKIP